nr:hypothetical protein [Tanacetum cinerariifolium]
PSPTLPIRKRYRGTSEPILDTKTEDDESKAEGSGLGSKESEDKGPESEGEEAAPEGQQHSDTTSPEWSSGSLPVSPSSPAVPTLVASPTDSSPVTVEAESFLAEDPEAGAGEGYSDFRSDTTSPEWSSGSLPVSPSSPTVPTLVASLTDSSPVASPVTVEAESFLAELGAHVEFQGGLVHDRAQRLDALPPTLDEGYDLDLRELYTRLIHDLLVQNTMMQRELQELKDRVTTLEQKGSRRGQ